MGIEIFNKLTMKHIIIKSILLLKFVSSIQLDQKQASQVLTSKLDRSRNKRGILDILDFTTQPPKQLTKEEKKELEKAKARDFVSENNLNSVEAWEEYKDKLEENSAIPEEEVDELERCTARCWWKNGATKIFGRNHHELKELAEKRFERTGEIVPVPIACPKCIRDIPIHADAPVEGLWSNFKFVRNLWRTMSGATGRKRK